MISPLQEKLEQMHNRTMWILELTWEGITKDKIFPFNSSAEALNHQLEVLDSIVNDYLELRKNDRA